MLIRALVKVGVDGLTLLDIGGGIGAVQLDLLRAGVTRAISVEVSSAYLAIAKEEASRAGLSGRISYHQGDFVSLASQISEEDVVTLDRVICCYHDVDALVSFSAAKARKVYALVYPRAVWWVKAALFFENLGYRLRRSPFRAFVHPTELVDRIVRDSGFTKILQQTTLTWQVVVYQR
jgi:magnesium-protoporphyrin O-methyltransferase